MGLLSLGMIPDGLLVPANYPKKIILHLSDLLLPILCIFGVRVSALWQRSALALWALLLCAVASLLSSPFAHYPIPYLHLWHLITPFLLFLFIANQNIDLTRIFRAFVAAATLQSLISLAQYLYQSSLGLKFLGELRLHPYLHSTPSVLVPGASLWRFDFDPTEPIGHLLRVSGTVPHPNILGGMLVISLLMSYFLLYRSKRPWLLSSAILLQVAALFLTYSRAALFGWAGATLLWCLFLYRARANWRLPAALFTLSCTLSLFLLWPQYSYRGGVFNYPIKVQIGDGRRLHFQDIAFAMIQDKPLSGVGYTQFTNIAPAYNATREGCVHNIYLLIASEMGLPALLAFLIFIGSVLLPIHSLSSERCVLTIILLTILWSGCVDFYPMFALPAKMALFLIAALLANSRASRLCADFPLQKLRFSLESGIQKV